MRTIHMPIYNPKVGSNLPEKDIIPVNNPVVATEIIHNIGTTTRGVAEDVNALVAHLDLTNPEAMEFAQELLKRLAFLQSTSRFLSNIDFIKK